MSDEGDNMSEEEKLENIKNENEPKEEKAAKGFGGKKNKELKEKDKQIEELTLKNQELENKIKYVQAEMINYGKRRDQEMSDRAKYANFDLLADLILILDNFERAIGLDDNNLSDELSKFLVGFKMIYGQLNDTIKKYGVNEIEALGKPFDPMLHEAVMTDQDDTRSDNEILDVLLKGYQLKDRVLRHSMVKVNQLPKEETMNENNENDKGEMTNE